MSFTIFYNEKTPFQAIKAKRSKSRKIYFFSQRVNPWFWSKSGHFSNFSFQEIQARKMFFRIFQNGKTPFQAIKARSLKIQKIHIFAKGLVHGFDPQLTNFSVFLQARKISFTVFQNKEHLLGYRIKKFRKSIFQKEKMPLQLIKTRSVKSGKIKILISLI